MSSQFSATPPGVPTPTPSPSAPIAPHGQVIHSWRQTLRPIGTYALDGLVWTGEFFLTIDSIRGYLLKVDPKSHNTTILNPYHLDYFRDATGLAIQGEMLWFTRHDCVYGVDNPLIHPWHTPPHVDRSFTPEATAARISVENAAAPGTPKGVASHAVLSLPPPTPLLFTQLPYGADGIAIWDATLYVSCQKSGHILVYDAATRQLITRFQSPGVGVERLTIRDEELWVVDSLEQTVYCVDRATGDIQFSLLTPFPNPTGIAFTTHPGGGQGLLYISYANEEAYIRDNPNADDPRELAVRDRTFIHPLHFQYQPNSSHTLSTGYRLEMSYVEELSALDAVCLTNVEWRIALPSDTPRQRVLQVDPIGLPFTEEEQNGQRVAVFRFNALTPHEGRLFGWKAVMEVWSIKYHFHPGEVTGELEKIAGETADFNDYLLDDGTLAMDTATIRAAAQRAVGTETNILRKMLKIRNFVYDRLSYGIKPRIDTPDVVLERGIGSCGEYVGLLLALSRLNGIPCRTVGRYKCPPTPDYQLIPLQPDYNHVWLEFYLPGIGWMPMESNPDDILEQGPYPSRFFMGLCWYHIEIGKGIPFERVKTNDMLLKELPMDISIGDLALNHVRFMILDELAPIQNPPVFEGKI